VRFDKETVIQASDFEMSETTVFIVDDDEDLRSSLVDLVETADLKAEAYGSAKEFLDVCKTRREGCLVVDIHMPGMDGLELQGRLKADGIGIPVIVITGRGDVPKAVKALKAGAVDFIEKPFGGELVLSSIRRAIEIGKRARAKGELVANAAQWIAQLTPREREVLDHLVVGHSNKTIAAKLAISPRTVEVHRARVMEKMHARSLSHLVRMALAVEPDEDA
jgi:two-component system response regulator FixJ